jgi:hypothetical protein
MRSILFALFFFSASAFAQIQIEKPWSRATAPGAKVGGGYMLIRNQGAAADKLVAASSPAAGKVELHVHINEGGVMKMREVPGYNVPAKGAFELKPGGAHLMLVDLKKPLKEGEKVAVVLRFEKSGEVKVDFEVRPLAAPASGHKH